MSESLTFPLVFLILYDGTKFKQLHIYNVYRKVSKWTPKSNIISKQKKTFPNKPISVKRSADISK